MEKTSEPGRHPGIVKRAWADLLALRPAFALAAVWLTTAGHTASFREMIAARGWVTARRLQPALDFSTGDHPDPARRAASGALVRQLSAGRRRAGDARGRLARERRVAPRTVGSCSCSAACSPGSARGW